MRLISGVVLDTSLKQLLRNPVPRMTSAMANASSDDQQRTQPRVDDPALAVATKRVVALEAEILNLRKGMLQQLTVSGKLLKSVFALDSDYFGGRFQEQADQDSPDPFRDFSVATKIVEAVGEEVQGASAFADSPILRDGIANLIAALESARDLAGDMEKSGIDAVGLPVKPEIPKVRVFPDNNPPACLAETAASVHDLASMMRRTRDRFSAMHMMLSEAERARAEAENAVTPVNVEKVASSVTNELKQIQQELKTTRAQLMSTIDSHAESTKQLKLELERVRSESAYESEARKSDRAEMRSLAAEIARQIELATPKGKSDDLDITLSVLRESLSDEQDLSSLISATESLIVDWIHLQQTAAPAEKSEQKAAPINSAADTAALENERAAHQATKAELAALKNKLAENDKKIAALQQAGEKSGSEWETLRAKLKQSEEALLTREAALKAADEQNVVNKTKLAQLQSQVDAQKSQAENSAKTAQQSVETSNRDIVALRAQLSQATTALRLKEDEAKRARETLQQEQGKQADTFQNLTRQLHAAQEKLALTTSELQTVRNQANESARAAQENVARVQHEREQELKLLRDNFTREIKALTDAKVAAETTAQQIQATLKQSETTRTNEVNALRQNVAALETRSNEALAKYDTAQSEAARLKAELGRLTAEHNKISASLEFTAGRERQLSTERERLERERSELQARLEALRQSNDATLNKNEQSLSGMKKELSEVRAAEQTVREQVQKLSSESKAFAEQAAKLEQELKNVRGERDKLASTVTQAGLERDQARMKVSDMERERAKLTENHLRSEALARSAGTELTQLKRSEQEAQQRAEKLQGELQSLRERMATMQESSASLAANQNAWKSTEAQLLRERDTLRTQQAQLTAERDRLKASEERLQNDVVHAQKQLKTSEEQLQSRLQESARQIGELKEAQQRVAAENERIKAEAQRMASATAAREDALERKNATGTWAKQLSDSHNEIEKSRQRLAELERKLDEQRGDLATLEEKLARGAQSEQHTKQRMIELERRETALGSQLAATKAEAESARARIKALEQQAAQAQTDAQQASAKLERQKVKFEALMREAREAVVAAKIRQEQTDVEDKVIIGDLMKQVQELRLRTGTR
jgi:chromosome segregation ATPase